MKSARKDFYPSGWSIRVELSRNMSLWLRAKILGLLVDTLTADDKYSRDYRENLTQPIQMELSKSPNFFLQVSLRFWELHKFLNILKKMMSLIVFETDQPHRDRKTRILKCLKGPFWEQLLAVNLLTGQKNCWNIVESTFIFLIDQSEMNSVWKVLGLFVKTLATNH